MPALNYMGNFAAIPTAMPPQIPREEPSQDGAGTVLVLGLVALGLFLFFCPKARAVEAEVEKAVKTNPRHRRRRRKHR